ncbi:MAG TPA: diadenylate cyclase CdaA [Spirochaetales bacterium]|nr:diadenylate cyclase CdaA [Spirochaetales bacterium]HPG85663.1 diadenylate cyclase CdaA [Spirochaetales bacterium]HPM72283.1 diadenylate cyclase CdaA [Spirochaetales bacterium]
MGIQAFFNAFTRWARPALDIAILAYLLYAMYRLLIKTQAVQLAKGAALLVFVYAGAFFLKLETLSWVLNLLAPGLVIAMAIIFQPELRKIFIKLGQGGIFKRGQGPRSTQLDAILHAAELLAEKRRGALIAFVRFVALDDIVERGTRIDGEVSSALILSIFEYDTPLHDGALIVKEGRILAAGCFLPLSEQRDIKRSFGTRHRAALGLTESADAVVLIVSEETGAISLAYDARLYYNLGLPALRKRLGQLLESSGKPLGEEAAFDE